MTQIRQFFLGIALWLCASMAAACPVCVDLPQNTMADHLLGDAIAVLARPGADSPFRYEVTEVLRGNPDDLTWLPEIPYLVSTSARRALAADPGAAVLLTYGPPKPDAADPFAGDAWHKHMTVTPARRALVDGILDEGPRWFWGMTEDPERFDFFAAHLGSGDPTIRDAALAEISRAPYALIRQLGDVLPPEGLRARLTELTELPYAPISILLLGLSSDPSAQDYVRARFQAALATGGSRLDAWSVAAIEVDAEAAVGAISAALDRGGLTAAERSDLALALSVAGSAREELRGDIAPVLRRAARRHPDLAADVAYAFYDWRDWSLTPYFKELLAGSEIDHATRYILEIAVATAEDAEATDG